MSIFNVPNYFTEKEKLDAKKWEIFAKNQDGQKKIISAAITGDRSAINYLFIRSSSTIFTAFKHFVGTSAYYRRKRIEEGDYTEFLSYAYQILLATPVRLGYIKGDDVSTFDMCGSEPLALFKPELYYEHENLIEKFKWFYLRTLYHTAEWANRERAKRGFGGVTGKEAITVGIDKMDSFDAITVEVTGKFPDEVFENLVSNEKYLLEKWLKFVEDRRLFRQNPISIASVLKTSLSEGKNFSINAFSEKTGISKCSLYNVLKRVQPILSEYDIDEEDFCNMIKKFGGETLSEYL